MRVVQAIGWYFPESLGGTEVYVAALAERLARAGCAVRIAAPDPGARVERRYEHAGVPVFRYPIPSAPTREEARGGLARGADRLHAWLRADPPDVFHAHTFVTGLGLPELAAARAVGARVVVTTHSARLGFLCQRGTLLRFGAQPCDGVQARTTCAACALDARGVPLPLARAIGAVPPALGRLARRLPGRIGTALAMGDLIDENRARQRELLDLADRFVLLTRAALDAVLAHGAPRERLALHRLGVSQRGLAPKPDRPARPPIAVGYLGRFEDVKGVEDLVAAVAALPPSVPLRLELRGPVRTAAERRLVGSLRALAGGDPRIALLPPVAPEEAPAVLAGWDLLCCPSRAVEGGPTVALEAHAVGTPVVGTRLGGLAEIVSDAWGALVAPGDRRGLAALLGRLAAAPETIDRWRRALPPVRTMDDVARDTLALYRELGA